MRLAFCPFSFLEQWMLDLQFIWILTRTTKQYRWHEILKCSLWISFRTKSSFLILCISPNWDRREKKLRLNKFKVTTVLCPSDSFIWVWHQLALLWLLMAILPVLLLTSLIDIAINRWFIIHQFQSLLLLVCLLFPKISKSQTLSSGFGQVPSQWKI